ncbi:MAG: hypothetical protein OXU54_05640 [Gammaproteobacteria bacterium]|nr:hypothetical protein [Gammaproteobacteria bacterium]MDD9864038.1 hypothetical protein [Gammaproteobacteria bacterium]
MTQLLVYLTLAVVAAIVLVLVAYLVGIILALWGALQNLKQLAAALIQVRDHTEPLAEHMQAINGGLSSLLNGLADVDGNLAAIVRVAGSGFGASDAS